MKSVGKAERSEKIWKDLKVEKNWPNSQIFPIDWLNFVREIILRKKRMAVMETKKWYTVIHCGYDDDDDGNMMMIIRWLDDDY